MRLSSDTFKTVVQNTPLISIDLVVKNIEGEILIGRRINKPAKDYWFVPGGRIFKNETLQDAFQRILVEELGNEVNLSLKNARFLGVFEHFYSDSVFGNIFSTHYLVLSYELNVEVDIDQLPLIQHEAFRWVNTNTLINDQKVHPYTKAYFYN